MLTKIYSAAVNGIEALLITIEVNVLWGAKFILVGLPDNAVKESKERIDSALNEIGLKIPGKRVIVNMAPADLRKEGAAYDLPIAIGIILADEQIKSSSSDQLFLVGELSLDGSILPVKGILPLTILAKKEGFKQIIVPQENANEAALVEGIEVYAFSHIRDVVSFIRGEVQPTPTQYQHTLTHPISGYQCDFKEVKGQEKVKRAFEIAAAGFHNLLLIGPPGAGKTMLAQRLSTILPPMSLDESLETTKIHSVAGMLSMKEGLVSVPPFRSPHHTISDVALIGGGASPRPGEISLAHNGVLFLDELPEFRRSVLEVLRQPLEERKIAVSRARLSVEYPANFMLIASMNPCPCGYYNHPQRSCCCPGGAVQKYLSKLSGPLMDRIDMHIEVVPVELDKITSDGESEASEAIRQRVINARLIQLERYKDTPNIHTNAQMTPTYMRNFCSLDTHSQQLLKLAMERLGLSARAYNRILKVARTIADLEGKEELLPQHVAEAIQYRSLDRANWGG